MDLVGEKDNFIPINFSLKLGTFSHSGLSRSCDFVTNRNPSDVHLTVPLMETAHNVLYSHRCFKAMSLLSPPRDLN